MTKPRTKLPSLFNALAFVLGAYYFYRLNWIEGLKLFKLFNVWGMFFDITAVILLSSFLPNAKRFTKLIVNHVSFGSIAFLLFFQIGVLITSAYAMMWKLPSAKVLALFHASLLLPLTVVWFLVEDLVSNSISKRLQDNDLRLGIFGSIFLISGLIMQFIGAILDLVGYQS